MGPVEHSHSEKRGLLLPHAAFPSNQRSAKFSRLFSVFKWSLCGLALLCYGLTTLHAQHRTRPDHHPPQHPHTWAHISPHYPGKASGAPFHWVPCFPNPVRGTNQHKFRCGYIDLPLDYTNSSDPRTTRIALLMYQAGPRKSKRTIVFNPGGPGGSGTLGAFAQGERISNEASDGTMDVLGFDPRGVNMTSPSMTCAKSDAYHDRWNLLTEQFPDGPAAEHIARLTEAMKEASWRACEEMHGDLLRFVTTTFVARDVDKIREALGEEELTSLVYSYGTHIMQEYAALFPDKVGRMVLDGVQFARYTQSNRGLLKTALGQTEDIWDLGIIGGCVRSGAKGCALIDPSRNTTAADLKKRLEKVLSDVKKQPIPATHPELGPGIITYESLLWTILILMGKPDAWPVLATLLADLERPQPNGALALSLVSFQFDPTRDPSQEWHDWRGVHHPLASTSMSGTAVLCSDAFPLTEKEAAEGLPTRKELFEIYEKQKKDHRFMAPFAFIGALGCLALPNHLAPAEAYRGNFTVPLKNPLLMVSSTYDPVTPLFNAQDAQAEWGADNVKLLVHHGFGHSSVGQPSKCSIAIQRDVILHGKWPDTDQVECSADRLPFPRPDVE